MKHIVKISMMNGTTIILKRTSEETLNQLLSSLTIAMNNKTTCTVQFSSPSQSSYEIVNGIAISSVHYISPFNLWNAFLTLLRIRKA